MLRLCLHPGAQECHGSGQPLLSAPDHRIHIGVRLFAHQPGVGLGPGVCCFAVESGFGLGGGTGGGDLAQRSVLALRQNGYGLRVSLLPARLSIGVCLQQTLQCDLLRGLCAALSHEVLLGWDNLPRWHPCP